jgi:hypothetical protein
MAARATRLFGAPIVFVSLATLAGTVDVARADIVHSYSLGTGDSVSTVQIDFSNGNGYVVELRYDGELSGFGALQWMAAEIPAFTLHTETFPWGQLVAGMGFGSDYEYGVGDLWPVQNYWHYWVVNDAWEWAWSPEGASDRMLHHGSADAWVFGSDVPPQTVPGAPVFALALLAPRRRR